MAQVQFNSYAGGPHGGQPVVINRVAPGLLGSLGEMFNQIGQIPAEMQQAELKARLNDLLIKSLSTPQTIQQTTPGQDILTPKEGTTLQPLEESGQSLVGMQPATPQSIGDLFTKETTPSTTKTVPNPDYQAITSRMEKIGPAFGWKFPTPLEEAIQLAYAKSLGLLPAIQARGEEARKTEASKGEIRKDVNTSLYGNKSDLETQRQGGRSELLDRNIESREKIANEHNQTIKSIATDKNTNDQTKVDKILKERANFHNAEIQNYGERTKVLQNSADNLNDIRNIQQVNGYKDDLTRQLTQIDKIIAKGGSPEVAGELNVAVSNYNDIVDKIKQIDPGSNLSKMQSMDAGGVMNYIRSLGIPGSDQPYKTVVPAPAGQPPPPTRTPRATQPAQQPAAPLPNNTYTPSQITPEELKKRRENIFNSIPK